MESDIWNSTREQLFNNRVKYTISHRTDGVAVILKELPNGVVVRIQRDADLPGGYATLDEKSFDDITDAVKRIAEQLKEYTRTGNWL